MHATAGSGGQAAAGTADGARGRVRPAASGSSWRWKAAPQDLRRSAMARRSSGPAVSLGSQPDLASSPMAAPASATAARAIRPDGTHWPCGVSCQQTASSADAIPSALSSTATPNLSARQPATRRTVRRSGKSRPLLAGHSPGRGTAAAMTSALRSGADPGSLRRIDSRHPDAALAHRPRRYAWLCDGRGVHRLPTSHRDRAGARGPRLRRDHPERAWSGLRLAGDRQPLHLSRLLSRTSRLQTAGMRSQHGR
jgi:hypothetical protein